jgi:hypothetical protein
VEPEMSDKDLIDINKFLMDLHFIQANALVGAQLQDDKNAIAYMKRIAVLREKVKRQLKEKNT